MRIGLLLPAALGCGLLLLPPALAGSVTADSINDREAARQAAMEQMPRGATLIRSRCQEIQVGEFGLPRYRCTVWYSDPPAEAPPGAAGNTPVAPAAPLPPAPAPQP